MGVRLLKAFVAIPYTLKLVLVVGIVAPFAMAWACYRTGLWPWELAEKLMCAKPEEIQELLCDSE